MDDLNLEVEDVNDSNCKAHALNLGCDAGISGNVEFTGLDCIIWPCACESIHWKGDFGVGQTYIVYVKSADTR